MQRRRGQPATWVEPLGGSTNDAVTAALVPKVVLFLTEIDWHDPETGESGRLHGVYSTIGLRFRLRSRIGCTTRHNRTFLLQGTTGHFYCSLTGASPRGHYPTASRGSASRMSWRSRAASSGRGNRHVDKSMRNFEIMDLDDHGALGNTPSICE